MTAGALVYVSDDSPGITRRRNGNGFRYYDERGRLIADKAVVARIDALAIAPAYREVWICPRENGHVQATARDARGRKQYRYHDQWIQVRDANKYQHLAEFGRALPRIRRRVDRDLRGRQTTHEKMAAVVVRLLEATLIRIGSRQYARDNGSRGLTTMRRRDTSVAGDRVRFQFTGKGGVRHDVTVNDRRVASVIRRCMEIPGHELFRYHNGGDAPRAIDSGDVNAYLKDAGRGDFTAKHYRTWAASVFVMAQLQRRGGAGTAPSREVVADVIKQAARLLGNTPAVCRDCYIYPDIVDAYLQGRLPPRKPVAGPRGLNADERRFFAFLSLNRSEAAPPAAR